jgi:trigger factor
MLGCFYKGHKEKAMNITERKNEALYAEYTVTVPAKDVQKQIDARLKEVGKKVKIAGFRPGKAPLALLQQRYGDSVRGEALEKLVEENVNKTLKEKNIKPALQPKVEVTKFDNDNELEFTISVEKLPTIEPKDFSKISLEKLVTPVDDTAVTEALDRIAANYKDSKPLETKRAAKMGDIVRIDFDGSVDGKKLPGMNAKNFDLELGTNSFVDTFEEQLVGLKDGDTKTVHVKFPDDYRHPDLKGQNAVFEVTLHEVREATSPEMNDELAKKAGINTLEELKKIIKDQMQKEHDNISRSKLKRALLDVLDKEYQFDVPKGMLDAEYQQIWNYHLQDLKSRNMDVAESEKDEDTQKEFRAIADRRIRLGLLVSEIGERNKVTVTNQELHQAVMREAYNYQGQEQKVIEFYQKNPQALASLRAPIYEEKVVDYILTQIKLNEKQVSKEELLHDPDEDAEAGRKDGKAKKTAKKK